MIGNDGIMRINVQPSIQSNLDIRVKQKYDHETTSIPEKYPTRPKMPFGGDISLL